MANRINVVLSLDTNAFTRSINQATRQIDRFASKMESIGRDLTARVTLPIAGVGVAALSAFADFEKLTKGLEAIATESDPASKQLERLQKIAQNPGISLKQAVAGSIRLQAVGQSAASAEETLLQFSKAVALAGGTAEDLDVVTRQLSQIQSKGRILSEDFLVIAERVPAIGLALETAFGTKNIEAIRESGISAQEFVTRLTAGIAQTEAFQKVTGGLANSFDNFKQAVTASLVELGKAINETIDISGIMDRLSGIISDIVDRFKALDPQMKRFILLAAGIAAAIGPVLLAIGGIVKILPLLVGGLRALLVLFNPVTLAIAGLAAGLIYLYNNSVQFRGGVQGMIRVLGELVRIGKTVIELLPLLGKALAVGITNPALAASYVDAFKAGFAVLEGDMATIGDRIGNAFTDGFKDGVLSTIDLKKTANAIAQGLTPTAPAGTPFAPLDLGGGGGGSSREQRNPIVDFATLGALDLIPEKIDSITESNRLATQSLTELGASAEIVQAPLTALEEQFARNREVTANYAAQLTQLAEGAIVSFAETFADSVAAIATGSASLGSVFSGILDTLFGVLEKLGKLAIETGVSLLAITTALKTLTPAGAIGAIVAGTALIAVVKALRAGIGKILPFAEGGLVSGPTLALIGEGSGTSRTNPEVVAPLNQLRALLAESGGAGGAVQVAGVLRGDDIYLATVRAAGRAERRGGQILKIE